MKTVLRSLVLLVLALAALIWFAVKVRSTERQAILPENIAVREAFRRLQLQDENGKVPPDGWSAAYKQKAAMPYLPEAWRELRPKAAAAEGIEGGVPGGVWTSIGPHEIGGRIRSGAIIIHPRDANTIWLGATGGGVWKSTDAGDSWTTTTDFLANLNVGCLALDPTNSEVLYAGTGEAFRGDGIFKSADGGKTWDQLTSTAVGPNNTDFAHVLRLAICPANSDILLAGTISGLLRSSDGGESWSRPTGISNEIWDVRFAPTTDSASNNCVAGDNQGHVYYSTNRGLTWTVATWPGPPAPTPSGRVELAYARSNPAIVYAQAAFQGGQVYCSTDGGHSFSSRVSPASTGLQSANGNFNALWVDPLNPNRVLAGGEYLLRTTDGGMSWSEASSNDTHVDHHVIVEDPGYNGTSNSIVYGGNDGGIFRAGNIWAASPVSWENLNHNGLVITEFYGGAGNVATGKIIGGTQDQGSLRYLSQVSPPNNWTKIYGLIGGDGGFCAADQTDSNYFYGEFILLQLYRITNGNAPTATGEYIYNNPNPALRLGDASRCENGVCYANAPSPFVLDPNNPDRILAGGASLWRSNNVKSAAVASQVSWAAIKPEVGAPGNNISAIAVAQGDSNLIWVGHNDGSVYFTTNGTSVPPARPPKWEEADDGLPSRMCTRITIGAADPKVQGRTVYATFGGFYSSSSDSNVWKRESDGEWTSIAGNLPKVPIYSLAISPADPDILYLGTEIGVFASANGGNSWSPDFSKPANVCVQELFWMGPKLVAATYGRGIFTLGPADH